MGGGVYSGRYLGNYAPVTIISGEGFRGFSRKGAKTRRERLEGESARGARGAFKAFPLWQRVRGEMSILSP